MGENIFYIVCGILFLGLFHGGVFAFLEANSKWAYIVSSIMIIAGICIFFFCSHISTENKQKETYAKQIEIYETFKETREIDVDNCLIASKKGDSALDLMFSFFGGTEVYNILVVKDGVLETKSYEEWKKDVHKGKPTVGELRNLFGFNYMKVSVYESDFSDLIPEKTYLYVFSDRD